MKFNAIYAIIELTIIANRILVAKKCSFREPTIAIYHRIFLIEFFDYCLALHFD
jgi:hypothetical protein